jgi:hypothetical protein
MTYAWHDRNEASGKKIEGLNMGLATRGGWRIRNFGAAQTGCVRKCPGALRQNGGSAHAFSAADFFAEFNRHIPDHTSPANVPSVDDVIRHYPHIEHADKRHFCGWLDNNKQGNQVSAENLAKTRRLQGQQAHDFSKRRNQSTRRTCRREDAIAFFIPP